MALYQTQTAQRLCPLFSVLADKHMQVQPQLKTLVSVASAQSEMLPVHDTAAHLELLFKSQ